MQFEISGFISLFHINVGCYENKVIKLSAEIFSLGKRRSVHSNKNSSAL